jgi:hypothetical protein
VTPQNGLPNSANWQGFSGHFEALPLTGQTIPSTKRKDFVSWGKFHQ